MPNGFIQISESDNEQIDNLPMPLTIEKSEYDKIMNNCGIDSVNKK